MIPLQPVADRLKTLLMPATLRDVRLALDLARLMAAGELKGLGTVAFVIPRGGRGRAPDVAAGVFSQMTEEVISVVLSFAAIDNPTGDKAQAAVEATIDAVIRAIAGWTPSDTVGVFAYQGHQLVALQPGLLAYGVEFSISDQLRIFA